MSITHKVGPLYYLGRLCIHGHDWQHTGRTLRYQSDNTCKVCKNTAKRDRPGRAKAQFAKKIAYVSAIKLAQGCADCGYNTHPAALQFDHLPGTVKISSVAQMCNNTSMAKLRAEIAKCEVVCANCHSIRTYNRRRE